MQSVTPELLPNFPYPQDKIPCAPSPRQGQGCYSQQCCPPHGATEGLGHILPSSTTHLTWAVSLSGVQDQPSSSTTLER